MLPTLPDTTERLPCTCSAGQDLCAACTAWDASHTEEEEETPTGEAPPRAPRPRRQQDPVRRREQNRAYRAAHPAAMRAQQARYYARDREARCARARERYRALHTINKEGRANDE